MTKPGNFRWTSPAWWFVGAGVLLGILYAGSLHPADLMGGWWEPSAALAERWAAMQATLALCLLLTGFGLVFLRGTGAHLSAAVATVAPARRALLLAVLATVAALLVQFLLFDNIPHVTDAISHMFQAKLLAEGRLTAPLPPCPDLFFQHHIAMTTDGRWFTKYTPGHPLLLALGLVTRTLTLVVPLAHGLATLALYLLVRRLGAAPLAGWTALLFALSPLAVLLGGSFMSHTTFLAAALLSGWGLTRLFTREARCRWTTALGTGFGLGYLILIRPQDAVLALLVMAAGVIMAGPVYWKRIIPVGLMLVPGALPPLAVGLLWNHALYGQALAIGYGFTQTNFIFPMFQAQYGFSELFTFRDACRQTLLSLYRLDHVALGWPLTLPWLAWMLNPRRWERADVHALLAVLGVVALYFPYSYYGLEYEARYYYIALPFLIYLVVRGVQQLAQVLARRHDPGPWLRGIMGCGLLFSLTYYWPQRILPAYRFDYEQTSPRLHELARQAGLGRALILIPSREPDAFRYSSGAVYNDPLLRGDLVYARDPGSDTTCLQTNFPDRALYRFVPGDRWRTGTFVRISAPYGVNP